VELDADDGDEWRVLARWAEWFEKGIPGL